MNRAVVLSLANVLFKSYFRASRPGKKNPFASPLAIVALDVAVFLAPLLLIWYVLPYVPEDLAPLARSAAGQAMIGLPLIITSAFILTGILFELGQGGGLSSSEPVNWLPISPRGYVIASTLSVLTAYSFFLAFGLGATVPLALYYGFGEAVPSLVLLSLIAASWGAVVVEVIRSATNRVSTSVYRRSGKLGVAIRLALLILLLVAVQLAFNPYVLYMVLGGVAGGVGLFWFVPMVWPSVAIIDLLSSRIAEAALFGVGTLAFTYAIFELASRLRERYWSPAQTTIRVSSSTAYLPAGRSLFFLSPVEFAIAAKEFRSFFRRRDMARFLAIPFILLVAVLLPVVVGQGNVRTEVSSVGLLLSAEISFILPIMFSTIAFGQEGKAIANLYVLPISADQLIKGKLFPSLLISIIAVLAATGLMQVLSPLMPLEYLGLVVAVMTVVTVESLFGLGVGSRYPDFTLGPRSRFVTMMGFFLAFFVGGIMAIGLMSPIALHILGILRLGGSSFTAGIVAAIILTCAAGGALSFLSYNYCKKGVQKLLENLEA